MPAFWALAAIAPEDDAYRSESDSNHHPIHPVPAPSLVQHMDS